MAYDQSLEQRISELLGSQPGLVTKKMFGGVGFMLHGNMACGVYQQYLIVRVGPQRYEQALAQPHTRIFDITGRPMKGWVMVAPAGCASEDALQSWTQQGIEFALTLPAKE